MKIELALGWGLRVGGPRPYIGYHFARYSTGIPVAEKYHRAVRVAIVPLRELRRLQRIAGARNEGA